MMPRFRVVWNRTCRVKQECELDFDAEDLEKARAEADRLYDNWKADPWLDNDVEVLDIETTVTEIKVPAAPDAS